MKKALIVIVAIMFFSGCTKHEIEPSPVEPTVKDIFSVSQSNVTNAQVFNFILKVPGIYTLTLIDSSTNQVVSREKFYGVEGLNIMNIYTKAIQSKNLHLVLLDANNNQIGKTTITIK